ncbi:MAG: cytochrome [Proteobacteria bacterium]|nr:cytochrome [Pseudomonadota bacterium]
MPRKTALSMASLLAVLSPAASADPITEEDEKRWEQQFQQVAQEGRKLWTSPELGTNGVACAQCHPNAANTHPETYPKFQKQLGKVVTLWEMVNWCIRNPLQGKPLDPSDAKMIAIQAYVTQERRGVPLAPGKH